MRQNRPAILLVLLATVCAVTTAVRAKPVPPGQRGGQPAQAAPTGPMAPAVYKNIQILTDVPADQLDLAMRFVSAAVGMPCLQCHVQDATTGEWAYEKDDKRPKQTARTMMKMVYAIRAGNFGVNANCATCHNGRNRPPGLPLVEPMTPEQIAAASAAAAARQGGPAGGPGAPGGASSGARGAAPGARGQQGLAGPPVDEVLTKYAVALGGPAALAKLQSRVMSGTLTTRNGQAFSFTIEEKATGKYRETVQVQSAGQTTAMTRAFDGTTGWSQSVGPAAELTGFPLQQALRGTDTDGGALVMKAKYTNVTSGRPTRIDGADVNLLQTPNGPVTERFYFDATSSLLVRRSITTRTPMGNLTEQIDFSDYRDVAGVKMPFVIKRTNWGAIETLRVVDIKPNAQIDDARFARPK